MPPGPPGPPDPNQPQHNPTDEPFYREPPTRPMMPGGSTPPGYSQAPGPSDQPTAPFTPPSYDQPGYGQPPAAPPGYPPAPQGGYSLPPYVGGGAPGGMPGFVDPLVPADQSFGAWFAKLQEVGKRSWKAALIIVTIAIAAPMGLVRLVQTATGSAAYFGPGAATEVGDLMATLGTAMVGLFFTLLAAVAAGFVAALGWAAGVWALTHEAATGQPANLGDALRYGLKRALPLWGWTLATGLLVVVGLCACVLPGLWVAFATCMFGMVVLFERGQNPIGRSFKLTHANPLPTLGKVAVLAVVALVYNFVVGGIVGVILLGIISVAGPTGILAGFVSFLQSIVSAPVNALLLIALLPLYAQLRATEGQVSTPQLHQELVS